MFRFLRVNMATKTCVFEEIPQEYAGLGGRALTSTIVAREVPPTCTAIGPHNKLVFAPGLLGATNSRLEMQTDFVADLRDVIDTGVGRLVDADMNEESTRLKALQTQQQLGIQALSIANTNSENVLSLFQ